MPPVFTTTTRSGIHVPTSANDGSNSAAGLLQMAEEIDNAFMVRSFGKSIVATAEPRTNAAYGLMPTPDRVQNIVMPADGLIHIAYQALWKESVQGAGQAAIFIGANRLKARLLNNNAFVDDSPAASINNAGYYTPIFSFPGGLRSFNGSGAPLAGDFPDDATTGQAVGGRDNGGSWYAGTCAVQAAAGTYDISVQFLATSGTVTVKNRKLRAWSVAF